MMIYGAKKWQDRTGYYTQRNNAIEELLRAIGVNGYLETCGPTSAVRCIYATGQGENLSLRTSGGWSPQPEDVLTLFMNDPSNENDFLSVRNNFDTTAYPENRIPQYYPFAVKKCFGVNATYDTATPEQVVKLLINGHAVQLLKPGHFVSGVAYDAVRKEIIYDDPLNGFNQRAKLREVEKWDRAIVIY
jgi:hypothetical protein